MSLESGRMAKQANGTVLVRYGDSMVMTPVTASGEPRDIDFFPLTVEYREKYYAAGRFAGGFIKRETRPSRGEILTCRLIDRPMRPLFPDGFRNEVQIVPTVLSTDNINTPDILAMIGASAAVTISDIPFDGPTAAVRVGYIDGEYVLNPTYEQIAQSELDMVVSGTRDAIMMVESFAKELSEDIMVGALEFAHAGMQPIIDLILELKEKCGKPKFEAKVKEIDPAIVEKVTAFAAAPLADALQTKDKLELYAKVDAIKAETKEKLAEEFPDQEKSISAVFGNVKSDVARKKILAGTRTDGRGTKDIRPITCEAGVLPRTHGSALFTRGETQSLGVLTLGTSDDCQRSDGIEGELSETFYLHYNFPPYSVGETGRFFGTGRREIGHGQLAQRALTPLVPDHDDFPYTIRIVSEILESNGSSSMASICAGTLAMLDAGVPMKKPVSGIAMGLVKEGEEYAILSDIQGLEDHIGDMDFKVAGTDSGITALQMDLKIAGLTTDIMKEALAQAHEGRKHILDKMCAEIDHPRDDISSFAPRIITIVVPKDKIRDVIGSGGKTIRGIIEETGVKMDVADDGTVTIASVDLDAGMRAQAIVEQLTAEAELGKIYLGKVVSIKDFGAFVEIFPGTDGLLHISQLSEKRVARVEDVVREGDEIMVKVIKVTDDGKISLSRREAIRDKMREQEENGEGNGDEIDEG